jgi:hypothetical protein
MPTAPRSNVEMDLGMLILGGLACSADGCLSSTPAQALVGIRLDEQQKQIAQKTAKITTDPSRIQSLPSAVQIILY